MQRSDSVALLSAASLLQQLIQPQLLSQTLENQHKHYGCIAGRRCIKQDFLLARYIFFLMGLQYCYQLLLTD